ncbi:Uncharacterised protein [Candidatus Norongarragalina meridionalis]|nr:Uncharacterised protein [Candidatus Norongarragalina meridionalis]
MKTVKFEVKVPEKASRWELLVRCVYWIPLVIVITILAILASICWVIQLLVILVTGKRNGAMQKYIKAYQTYQVKMGSYFNLLTDERPEILPDL